MLLKSCISRIGGKAYLTNWLCSFLPEHLCYVEPFAGGAKLLFAKKLSPTEILNDLDDNIVNLYKVIQNDKKRQELIKLLNETPYARSVFNHFKKSETQDDIEKAGRYFFLCKASFASDVEGGGFACPSTTGRNPAQSYYNAIGSIEHIAKRLRGVTIECLGYADCIQRYDSEDTLFYCDPPYWDSEHYYGDTFSHEDHPRLAELLHGIKGQVMVSHYFNSLYDDLYKGWNRYEYASFKGSHKAEPGQKKPIAVECLYTNFEPVKTRGLFDAME